MLTRTNSSFLHFSHAITVIYSLGSNSNSCLPVVQFKKKYKKEVYRYTKTPQTMNKRGNISAKHCFPESFPICTHMLLLHTNRETLLQKHFTQCICNSASSFAGAFSHKQVSSIFLREIQLLAQTEMPVLMMDFHAK